MRDDSAKWAPSIGREQAIVERPNLTLSIMRPTRQTLISGPHAAALKLAGVEGSVGWPAPVQDERYAVRVRRDRILAVNCAAIPDGWHAGTGLAVSDMTCGYAVIDLTGSAAFGLLQHGTEIALDPSASVAREFSGYSILLYAIGTNAFRLHVRRAHLDAMWQLLNRISHIAD